jgi:holin-like protein
VTGLIPLKEVEDAADFLVEIMPIMFIPATVGIMTSIEALKQMLVPLCVISIVSTVLVFGVTGRVTQGIIRRGIKHKTACELQGVSGSSEKNDNESVKEEAAK